ncbi:MAG: hypothetical protein AAFZ67_00415 [Planctomycetota bacterium]
MTDSPTTPETAPDTPTNADATAEQPSLVPPASRTPLVLSLVLGAIASLLPIVVGFGRSYFGFETETDVVSQFVIDAGRFLAGSTPDLEYHPPGYAALLALSKLAIDDWLVAGLVLTGIATPLALLASYVLGERLAGPAYAHRRWVGFACVASCVGSFTFLKFTAQATSEMPFTAVFLGALAFTACAARGSRLWWIPAGVLAACSVLMRTNGITIVPMLAVTSMLCAWDGRWNIALALRLIKPGVVRSLCWGVPFALVIAGWIAVAVSRDAPITPSKSHVNLASTYFAETSRGRYGESLREMEAKFESMGDVLSYDPAKMVTLYLQDLSRLPIDLVPKAINPLTLLLAVIGLFLVPRVSRSPAVLALGLCLAASLMFINFKIYYDRFYIFAAPSFGVFAGFAAVRIAQVFPRQLVVVGVAGLTLALVGSAGFVAHKERQSHHSYDAWMATALADMQPHLAEGDVVFERTRHVTHETPAVHGELSEHLTVESLRAAMRAQAAQDKAGAVYLFDTSYLKSPWKQTARDIAADEPWPSWLDPVASGDRWELLRFAPGG